MRDTEVQMRLGETRVAAIASQAENLPDLDALPDMEPICNGRQMRAVIAHAIIPNDGDRATAAHCRVICSRIPCVLGANPIDDPIRRRYKVAANWAKDISRRIIMVILAIANFTAAFHRKYIA